MCNMDTKASCAFTVTELLVGLVIVAVLLVVLSPTIGSFRAQALEAQCKARIKRLGTAHLNYANDNNGYFIPAAETTWGFWYDYLAPYFDAKKVQWLDNKYGPKPVWVPTWLQCPGKKDEVGYGWNQRFGKYVYKRAEGLDVGPETYRRLNLIARPGLTILHGDSKDLGVEPAYGFEHHYLYCTAPFKTRIAKRHGGKGNYVFVDGHVASYTPDEILKMVNNFDPEQP